MLQCMPTSTCPHCSREFNKNFVDQRHLAKCSLPADPDIEPCLCGAGAATSKMMKAHRRTCSIWQSRDKRMVFKERIARTSMKKFGVPNSLQAPEVRAKQAATNLARYGAVNPASRDSNLFQKVQDSLVGKRVGVHGSANSFSRPEVQEKIRATNVERYGVENPNQNSEVKARTKQTNLLRYGGSAMASPVLRARVEATNQERYGGPSPLCSSEIQDKVVRTNLLKFGVPYSCMDQEVRRKQLDTHHEKYGSHFFASEEGKERIKTAMQSLYGVDHPGSIEGHWEKVVATFRERYKVDHPLQLAEVLDKQHATLIERYGTPFAGLRDRGMNGLETEVFSMASGKVLFTGDGKWWRYLPSLKSNKNPDFIVPGPVPVDQKRGVTKVVEAFGDYWHSRMFTGRAPFEHEQELIEAYQEVGIKCLVLWESEVKKSPETVRARLLEFLTSED